MNNKFFTRVKNAFRYVLTDTRSGIYSVNDPIPEKKEKHSFKNPEPIWWESTEYCKANPFKKFWLAIKYGVIYDDRGEAHIKFPSLRLENENETSVVKIEIEGCQVELHFAKESDPGLEARVLSPLIDVMEEKGA